ncbi:hypothetical protein PLESTB_000913500 [Pleodorina starrii]|uniref:Protein PBN1 n=1 Tax=Pleodorina starrii TaxID=330485 RepID=A0A9W6BMP1_9CHLO|nr:hypothetical protein PLESTM_001524500 [Pleodorina starrii]GLC54858.1 hypothetical protein PLESTB_000913500 [Pleodorina starrii]
MSTLQLPVADIAARYWLPDGSLVSPAFPADDCLRILVTGEGFHQRVSYELTCSPDLLLAGRNLPQQHGEITILQQLPSELFVDPYELEQLEAVRAGFVEWELFGHVELEQPAPACHPTVLGVTLRNVTKRRQRRGSRPLYHAVDIPFHAKYPAPATGGRGCASGSILQISSGPYHSVVWPSPLLLLRTGPHRPTTSADEQEPLDAIGRLAAEPKELPLAAAAPDANAQQQQQQQQQQESQGPGDAQWSLMRVREPLPDVVAVPTGCMRHVGWVSLVTLVSALLCSGAVVAAALL